MPVVASGTPLIERTVSEDLVFWLLWVAATAFAGGLGLIVAALMVHIVLTDAYFSSAAGLTGDNIVPHFLAWGCGLVLAVGPLIGMGQVLVLKHFSNYPKLDTWGIMSAVGVGLALVGVAIASLVLGPLSVSLVPGAALGLFQWLALRRTIRGAPWWIVANTLGWVMSFAIGSLAAAILWPKDIGLPFYPVEAVVSYSIIGFITLAVFGGITGAVFIILARHSLPTQKLITSPEHPPVVENL